MEVDKYDRQLRLWGNVGQDLLEQAEVFLVTENWGSSVLFSEVLKNLMLLNVRGCRVVSVNKPCCGEDKLAVSLDIASTNNHLQANPSISVPKIEYWDDFDNVEQLGAFDLIVLVDLKNVNVINTFEKLINGNQIALPPILQCYAKSFYGYINIRYTKNHYVVDTHPDFTKYDLRIRDPWEKLKQHLNSFDLDQMSENEFAQLHYPVLLYKLLQKDMAANSQKMKILLYELFEKKNTRNNELNCVQALRYTHYATEDSLAKENVKGLISLARKSKNLASNKGNTSKREVTEGLLLLLGDYLDAGHQLPHTGRLPDMEASTQNFLAYKHVFKEKHEEDVENFRAFIHEKSEHHSLKPFEIELFCRNLDRLFCLEAQTSQNPLNLTKLNFESSGNNILNWLLASQFSDNDALGSKIGIPSVANKKVNVGGVVDAVLAGLIVQEAVKIITHQYIPIDDTMIYDGLNINFNVIKMNK